MMNTSLPLPHWTGKETSPELEARDGQEAESTL